jgi:hypothetical protein
MYQFIVTLDGVDTTHESTEYLKARADALDHMLTELPEYAQEVRNAAEHMRISVLNKLLRNDDRKPQYGITIGELP